MKKWPTNKRRGEGRQSRGEEGGKWGGRPSLVLFAHARRPSGQSHRCTPTRSLSSVRPSVLWHRLSCGGSEILYCRQRRRRSDESGGNEQHCFCPSHLRRTATPAERGTVKKRPKKGNERTAAGRGRKAGGRTGKPHVQRACVRACLRASAAAARSLGNFQEVARDGRKERGKSKRGRREGRKYHSLFFSLSLLLCNSESLASRPAKCDDERYAALPPPPAALGSLWSDPH